MPATHGSMPASERDEPDPRPTFRIFQNELGRWCAASRDGMVLGVFFKRDEAIRFARVESDERLPLVLILEPHPQPRLLTPKGGVSPRRVEGYPAPSARKRIAS